MEEQQEIQLNTEAPPLKPIKIEEELIKEYNIKGMDNTLYSIKICQIGISIIFTSIIEGDLSQTTYKKKVTIEEFHNISRLFKQYSSSKEIFKFLFEDLKEKEIIISKEDNNIKLCFLLEFRNKNEEFPFILNPEIDINNAIYRICEKSKAIDELNKEKENQKIINENIKKELYEYKKRMEEINNLLNQKGFPKKNDILFKIKDFLDESTIIKLLSVTVFCICLLIGPFEHFQKGKKYIYYSKYDTLKPKDLKVTEGEVNYRYIKLLQKGIQFGPYKFYEGGKYLVVYHGDKLDNLTYFDVFDNKLSPPEIPSKLIKKKVRN